MASAYQLPSALPLNAAMNIGHGQVLGISLTLWLSCKSKTVALFCQKDIHRGHGPLGYLVFEATGVTLKGLEAYQLARVCLELPEGLQPITYQQAFEFLDHRQTQEAFLQEICPHA